MRRVDVRIPAADGNSNGTLHVPAGDGRGRACWSSPTFDTHASERHWAALGSLYRARLNQL